MSKSLNKVSLIGFVGSKYELKKSQAGLNHISISLATNEKKSKDTKEETQWHRLIAFGSNADVIDKYVEKGHKLYIEGKISYGSYKNKEGIEVKTTDILVSNIIMLSKSDNPITEIKKNEQIEFENVFDDSDIPF